MTTIDRPVTRPTEYMHPETKAPGRTGWASFLSVLLLVVGLAAGFFVGRGTAPESTPTALPSDLAGTTVTKFLSDYVAAVNSGEEARIVTFYTTDAMMTSAVPSDSWVVNGNTKIAQAIGSWWDFNGFRLEKPGTAVQTGDSVTQSYDSSFGRAVMVFQLDGGKIVNQWIIPAR